MNRRSIPFLRLLAPFAAGLALGGWLDRPLPGLAWALVGSAGLSLVLARRGYAWRWRWLFGVSVYAAFVVAGYAHAVWHNEVRKIEHFSRQNTEIRVLIGTVDTFMVSHLGDDAVAGVGVASQVFTLFLIVFAFIGIGSSVVIRCSLSAS